jgi:hypothetical protein
MGNAKEVVIPERTTLTQSQKSLQSALDVYSCRRAPNDQRFSPAGIDTTAETRFIS